LLLTASFLTYHLLGPGLSKAQPAKEFKATIRNKVKYRPDNSQVWPAADARGGIIQQHRRHIVLPAR
jgi:hypothetical protein